MSLRVGSIKQGIVYAANFLYEDSNTPSRGRCIMEFKYDIISVSFDRGGLYAVSHIGRRDCLACVS